MHMYVGYPLQPPSLYTMNANSGHVDVKTIGHWKLNLKPTFVVITQWT